MSVHSSKKTALLHLSNCISSYDLKNLHDLANGDIFLDIISTSFPEFIHAEQSETKQNEEEKKETECIKAIDNANALAVEDIALDVELVTTPMDVSPVESENCASGITEATPEESHVEHLPSVGAKEEKEMENYRLIQKFIDDKYFLKSEEIVSYTDCMQANELEMSKVAFFLLSEVVKLYVMLSNNQLSTLAHLDSRVQEDLEECFKLFILERENISKATVEKVLLHPATYKASSPKKNSFITPRRSCASKYRVTSPSTPSNEDVFTNSPLKSFFESPVFKKEDLIRKDKEIARARLNLYEEECRTDDLKSEINDLKKKLMKKDDEFQKLKETLKELTEAERIKDEDIKQLIEHKEQYTKEFKAAEESYIRENSQLKASINLLEKEIKDYLNGACKTNNIIRDFFMMKNSLSNAKENSEKLMNELNKVKGELKIKKKELSDVNARLQSITFDYMKNESLYKEKLNDIKTETKFEPNSPVCGEVIGNIIEEENKMLQLRLNEAESKVKELEAKLKKCQMQVPLERDHIPTRRKTTILPMPELVDMSELSETQNFRDFQNEKELSNSLNVCDTLSSSENISKHSFVENSGNSELNVTKNSISRCDVLGKSENVSNNSIIGCDMECNSFTDASDNSPSKNPHWEELPFADPAVELYGTLWKNLNLENEGGVWKDQESNGSRTKKTIESLTFNEFLNLLKISLVNMSHQNNNISDIFADKKSDSDYLSSILKVKKSRHSVAKLMKDLKAFKELLLCLFIIVDSKCTITKGNFYDWVKSHLENGHKKMKGESEMERKIEHYAIQLKEKESEIERLKTSCSDLPAQLQEYKLKLEEGYAKIEDLQYRLRKSEKVGKIIFDKYQRSCKRLTTFIQVIKEKEILQRNLIDAETENKRIKNMYEDDKQKFNSNLNRKEQVIEYLQVDIKRLKNHYEKMARILRSEREKFSTKVKELESALREKDSAVRTNSENSSGSNHRRAANGDAISENCQNATNKNHENAAVSNSIYALLKDHDNDAFIKPENAAVKNSANASLKDHENDAIKNHENAAVKNSACASLKNHENDAIINGENAAVKNSDASVKSHENDPVKNCETAVTANREKAVTTNQRVPTISNRRFTIANDRNVAVKNHVLMNEECAKEPSMPLRCQRKQCTNIIYMSESFYGDPNTTNASRDTGNESTLSGALCNKNGFVCQDEEDFLNQSSLEDIKRETKDERFDELRRRNSFYPQHLQSSYPLEVDLPKSASEKLYVKKQEIAERFENGETSDREDSNPSKKRKHTEMEPETRNEEVPLTPMMKVKRFIRNPPSMTKMLNYRKIRPGLIKPKP